MFSLEDFRYYGTKIASIRINKPIWTAYGDIGIEKKNAFESTKEISAFLVFFLMISIFFSQTLKYFNLFAKFLVG